MIGTAPRPRGELRWALVAGACGVAAGAAAALSLPLAVGAIAVALLMYLFLRSQVRAEIVVGVYWLAFCTYETVFAGTSIEGFFYPFYAVFVASILIALARSGLRLPPSLGWLYGGFLFVVLLSFVGFAEPTTFAVIQRVFAYLFAGLVVFQVGSHRGLVPIAAGAVAAGLTISGWVLWSSIEGGFSYRGDVGVDQNAVTFYLGFGLLLAFGFVVDRVGATPRRYLGVVLAALAFGFMVYATLLLASRGITIAIVLAMLAMTLQAALQNWRTLLAVVVVVALGVTTMLLPGGDSLVERFGDDTVQTGNNRLPIWEATIDAYTQGDVRRILLGSGFDSSKFIVQQSFGSLTSTHNAFIQVLYEFGVVGLLLFVGLHALLLVRSWAIRGGFGLAMVGIVWYLVGANLVVNAADGFMYWTAIGFVMAIAVRGDERAGPQATS
jgi:O-antigen ligase